MDAAYQIVRLRTFYPVEAVIIALVLAFVPYLLARGSVTRVASWWMLSRTARCGQMSAPTLHAGLCSARR
jgi:hypothetical protein